MKKYLTLLVYLLIAAGLFVYIFMVDKDNLSTTEQELQKTRLFDFLAQDIERVRLKRAADTVVLERRDDGNWEMVEPLKWPAAAPIMKEILERIAYARKLREDSLDELGGPAEEKLKSFGLQPPVVDIEVTVGGEVKRLHIGSMLPAGEQVFARLPEEENASVLLLPDRILRLSALQANDMRGRIVFPRKTRDIVAITERRAGEGIDGNREESIALNEEGDWALRRPLIYPVYKEGVQHWLGKAKRLRVEEFITDEPESLNLYGLATPQTQILLEYEDGEKATLLVGKKVPAGELETEPDAAPVPASYYAKMVGSPSVFALSQEKLNDLRGGLMELRDRTVLHFTPKEVSGLKFVTEGAEVEVYLEDDDWKVTDSKGTEYKADHYQVFDLVVMLSHLEVFEFVKDSTTDLQPYGLDKPRASVTLEQTTPEGEKAPSLKLNFGKAKDDLVYAKIEDRPYVYAVPKVLLGHLPRTALELRHKRLFPLEASEVEEVRYETDGQTELVLARDKDGLFTSNREGRVVRAPAAEALFSLLAQLRAGIWTPAGDASHRESLGKTTATFRMKTKDGREFTLKVGEKVSDLAYAAEAVFPDKSREWFILSSDDLNLLGQDVFFPETGQ